MTHTYVLSLAVSGSNVFAGTGGGGVFLSTNNGTSWAAVNTGLTNTSATSFAVSGSNVFAGTFGGGVFLSTNNGTSWAAVNTGLANTLIRSLAASGSNIFAGTDGSGVWSRPLSDFGITPTITSFSPSGGAAGTSVTIVGTNFSTTLANNIVKFNNTTAVVTASTATSITTTVPAGATNGTITVTVSGQTATSSANFTVNTSSPWFGVYVNDLNHPHLKKNELLDSSYFNSKFLLLKERVKICADGSDVTIVKYVNHDPSIINANITFNIESNFNQSTSGYFSNYEYKGDTVIAKYHHPEYVETTEKSIWGEEYRPDKFQIKNRAFNTTINDFKIIIVRAPVLFVHGLWGGSASFYKMDQSFRKKIRNTHRVDYGWKNASGFYTNRLEVRFGIDDLLRQTRNSKYSAGKAIIIGHSMGGILSRLYLQSTYSDIGDYRNDISRLITINTPHFGTQLANWLATRPRTLQMLNEVLGGGNNHDVSAVIDLMAKSRELSDNLNISPDRQNKVPSTTIVTDAVGDNSDMAKTIRKAISFISSETEMFKSEVNDLIVPISSQESKLKLNSLITSQMHLGSTEKQQVIDLCLKLIDESPTISGLFTRNGFPTGYLEPPTLPSSTTSPSGRESSLDSIKILNPISGKIYNPGDSVTVDFFKSNTISNYSLIVFGNSIDPITNVTQPNPSLKFKIPTNAIGLLRLWAIGSGSNNSVVHDTTHILVKSTIVPDSIVSSPRKTSLALGETMSVSVSGYFAGNAINLGGAQDLIFSFDPQYIKKIAVGIFQGVKVGSTNVLISYKGKTFTLQIDIENDPSRLMASFDQSATSICSGSSVEFQNKSVGIGTGLSWNFPGGSPPSSTQPNPTIIYSTPGQYLVKLKTTFVNGLDSAFIDNLITVKPVPAKPVITLSGATLTSSAAQGNQWYLAGLPIKGETNQILNATEVGTYTVISTINKCASQASSPMDIRITGILQSENSLSVYPNPNNGRFIIKKTGVSHETQIEIFSIIGAKVFEATLNKEETEIDLVHLSKGIYLIKPKTNSAYLPVMKIIVQ